MLKDTVDFEYAINKVKEDINLDITLQDKILDSKKMNDSFQSIEDSLWNILYLLKIIKT